jgi:hypothetical protein
MTALVVALAVACCCSPCSWRPAAQPRRDPQGAARARRRLGAGPLRGPGRRDYRGRPDAPTRQLRDRRRISGETLDGEAVALSLATGTDTLLAFLSSGCTTCGAFWEAFAEQDVEVPGGARLVVVTKGLDEESGSALVKRAPRTSRSWRAAAPGRASASRARRTSSTWTAPGRIVGEGSAATWPAVATLMGQAHADDAHRTGRLSREGATTPRWPPPASARGPRPVTVLLLVGLPLAALAAIRSTWSP